jgi:hypothetical protein
MVTPADVPDILGDLDEPFLEQLRSLLVEQNLLLEVLRDDDARYSAMSRDAASSRRHVTQFTLFPGDRVSHEGQVYKLMSIDTSTPSEPATARIRNASHEDAPTRIVRYSSLRPLASPRPEHMHSTVATDSMQVGKFVFFSSDTSANVLGGKIVSVDVDAACITVHEHRQASIATRRFTPLYTNTAHRDNRMEAKEKPQPCHVHVFHDVPINRVHDIVVGNITGYHVHQYMLDSLRSMGIVDE